MSHTHKQKDKLSYFQILILLVAGIILSACGQSNKDQWKPRFDPPEASVNVGEYDYYVAFDQSASKPYLSDAERLTRDLGDVRLAQVEQVELLVPQHKFDERANNLKSVLSNLGFDKNKIKIVKEVEFDNIALVRVHEWRAEVADCPNWNKPHGTDYKNSLGPNFGCSTAQNLALMVDNPHDLERGRTASHARSDQGVLAQQRYRSGEIIDINRADGVLASSE